MGVFILCMELRSDRIAAQVFRHLQSLSPGSRQLTSGDSLFRAPEKRASDLVAFLINEKDCFDQDLEVKKLFLRSHRKEQLTTVRRSVMTRAIDMLRTSSRPCLKVKPKLGPRSLCALF